MASPDDHMQKRTSEKAEALTLITGVLHLIERQRREPDAWERVYLAYALSSVFSGCYGLAATEARLALTPQDERSADAHLPTDAVFERCDLKLLKKVKIEAEAAPVRQFAHLGPVVLV